jgi:hypothetical protein
MQVPPVSGSTPSRFDPVQEIRNLNSRLGDQINDIQDMLSFGQQISLSEIKNLNETLSGLLHVLARSPPGSVSPKVTDIISQIKRTVDQEQQDPALMVAQLYDLYGDLQNAFQNN